MCEANNACEKKLKWATNRMEAGQMMRKKWGVRWGMDFIPVKIPFQTRRMYTLFRISRFIYDDWWWCVGACLCLNISLVTINGLSFDTIPEIKPSPFLCRRKICSVASKIAK